MALQADFHLAFGSEPRRIHDRRAHTLHGCALVHGIDMTPARTVAALAIDPFWQPARIDRAALPFGRARVDLRITVVTEHATVIDLAAEALVSGPVVTGAHSPVAAILRIPGHGKLHQFIVRGAMQVTARMIA